MNSLKKTFLSIDPGFVNLGYIYGQYIVDRSNSTIIVKIDPKKSGTYNLKRKADADIPDLYVALNSFFLQCDFDFDVRTIGIIEKQHWKPSLNQAKIAHQLNTIQNLIYCALMNRAGLVEFVLPQSYKKKLKINSNKNKSKQENAINFAKELFENEKDKSFVDTDHKADAINQAYWWFKHTFELTFGDQWNVKVEIQ